MYLQHIMHPVHQVLSQDHSMENFHQDQSQEEEI